MAKLPDAHERIAKAADLARDVAPDLGVILLTHYPDADTLDTLHPGETDLATAVAVNRAVASAMLEAGVEILVQRADRAAFRRWMSSRDDTPANRRAWIDRANLLRGPAALQLLGIKAPAAPPQRFGKAPGPVADHLLDAFADEDSEEFDGLVQALMAAGRTDVLDLAVRKSGEREGEEEADALNWVLLVAAEGAALGPSGWAELVVLPVALPSGEAPDGEALGQGLIASGALAESEELRLLPGWRSPTALTELSYGGVRRVLLDLLDEKAPRDLPPGDTDELARRGFGALLGLRIDWAIPIWEEIEAEGGLPGEDEYDGENDAEDAAPTPEETRRIALFDAWRSRVFQEGAGCVPLNLVPLSEASQEIVDFLAEAGEQTEGLEAIREFVATARREAGGEDVVCQPDIVGEALELSLYTESGRLLDRLTVPPNRLPAPAREMAPLLSAFVRLVPSPGS